MNKQKGITLVSLVITIIVLLILVAVSISMLSGQNGVLTKASNANDETNLARVKEAVSLAYSETKIDYATGGNTDKIKYYSSENGNENQGKQELKQEITGDGSITITSYTDPTSSDPIIEIDCIYKDTAYTGEINVDTETVTVVKKEDAELEISVSAEVADKTTTSITIEANVNNLSSKNSNATLYTKTADGQYTASATGIVNSENSTVKLTAQNLANYTDYTYYVEIENNGKTYKTSESTERTYCPGTGHIATEWCPGGTEEEITCPDCNGEGWTGEGLVECSGCMGKCEILVCDSCHEWIDSGYDVCPNCGGTMHEETCPTCGGLGYFNDACNCERCHATGKVKETVPCEHGYGYEDMHYYCLEDGCSYTGYNQEHCVHGRSEPHDD